MNSALEAPIRKEGASRPPAPPRRSAPSRIPPPRSASAGEVSTSSSVPATGAGQDSTAVQLQESASTTISRSGTVQSHQTSSEHRKSLTQPLHDGSTSNSATSPSRRTPAGRYSAAISNISVIPPDELLDLLCLCLGNSPDKAFVVDIDPRATVSRLRSILIGCTQLKASEINIFAVKPGKTIKADDPSILSASALKRDWVRFTMRKRWGTTSGFTRRHAQIGSSQTLIVDPVVVEQQLPVVWLKDPTQILGDLYSSSPTQRASRKGKESAGDEMELEEDPSGKATELKLLIALDPGAERVESLKNQPTLRPPPAYNEAARAVGTGRAGSRLDKGGQGPTPRPTRGPFG
ncbi:hypothetical protein HDU96_006604 [Phlyctochytrium bullatum]|nr:hypothetical protein HDU96_006604 [Phlyctochytrium bullatum]